MQAQGLDHARPRSVPIARRRAQRPLGPLTKSAVLGFDLTMSQSAGLELLERALATNAVFLCFSRNSTHSVALAMAAARGARRPIGPGRPTAVVRRVPATQWTATLQLLTGSRLAQRTASIGARHDVLGAPPRPIAAAGGAGSPRAPSPPAAVLELLPRALHHAACSRVPQEARAWLAAIPTLNSHPPDTVRLATAAASRAV